MVPDSSPSDAVGLDADAYADHVLVRLRDGRDVWIEIPDYNRIFRVCRQVLDWKADASTTAPMISEGIGNS